MKKVIAAVLVASMLSACGNPAVLGGKEYPTYGLINEGTSKSEKVCYEAVFGNVVWSVLLIETVIMPVYFVGWSLWEPVSLKKDGKCGVDAE